MSWSATVDDMTKIAKIIINKTANPEIIGMGVSLS
jgi:hypothetical protein